MHTDHADDVTGTDDQMSRFVCMGSGLALQAIPA
jgi:hypothetical protein